MRDIYDESYSVFEFENAAGTVVETKLSPHGIPVYRTGEKAIAVVDEAAEDVDELLEAKGLDYSSVSGVEDVDLDSWFNEQDWQESFSSD